MIRLVVAALLAAACGTGPGAPDGSGDLILLVGADVFAGGDAVASHLDAMTALTDVLGPARFEVVTRTGASIDDLPVLLARGLEQAPLEGVRAAVVIVGDLTVFPGVDPHDLFRAPRERIRRELDDEHFDAVLDALAETAARARVPLILATAPLGRMGRVEVPELMDIARRLVEDHGALPLQSWFLEHEQMPLFSNGIDRLDEWGHEKLAHALWLAFIDGQEPIPSRNEAERAARAEARALRALVETRDDFDLLVTLALATAPVSARSATRQAALTAARDGLEGTNGLWEAIEPVEGQELPGYAVGRTLALRQPTPWAPVDPVEAGLLEVFTALGAGPTASPSGLERAEILVAEHPHRLEAWVGLQVAASLEPLPRDVRSHARNQIVRFSHGALEPDAAQILLAQWPAVTDQLPALLIASRPYAFARPGGEVIEHVRRRAFQGYLGTAVKRLETTLVQQDCPSAWHDELQRLKRL